MQLSKTAEDEEAKKRSNRQMDKIVELCYIKSHRFVPFNHLPKHDCNL